MSKQKILAKRIFWSLMFLAWVALIAYFTVQDGDTSATTTGVIASRFYRESNKMFEILFGRGISYATFHFYIRKLGHFMIHAGLAFITVRTSLWMTLERSFGLKLAWVFAIAIAVLDEMAQMLIPGRYTAVMDFLINLSGVIVGAFISSLIGPRSFRIKKKAPPTRSYSVKYGDSDSYFPQ